MGMLRGCGAQEADTDADTDAAFLWKLLLISAGGGALIKFGSVAAHLPDLQPNLPLALAIIGTLTAARVVPW